jgi:hypothetical protein
VRVIIGFSTPKKWKLLSWAIKFLTKSEVSHAWFLVDDPVFGIRMVMDSYLTGLRLIPLEHFLEGNRVVYFATPLWNLDKGLLFQSREIGDKYDLWGLAGMAYVSLMWRWFKKKVKNPLAQPGAMFCSEAVVRVLQFSGFPDSTAIEPESTNPGELLQFFKESQHVELFPGEKLQVSDQPV